MTTANITVSALLGKFVSFNKTILGDTYNHSGLIKSVCLDIDGDHSILLDCDFFKLSEIDDLKITDVLS